MTIANELSDWIWKVVRGLRDEDEVVFRTRFKEQWRQYYDGFLASGKSEKEAGSLALAQMGDARKVRVEIREKILTQAEWHLLEVVGCWGNPDDYVKMSRRDSLLVLSVFGLLLLPVWIFVPLNVLGKGAFFFAVFGGMLSVVVAVAYIEKAFERWIRKNYSMSKVLVWRAWMMPLSVPFWMCICLVCAFLTDFLLGPDECERAPICDSAGLWLVVIMAVGLGGWLLGYQIYKHLALAKKLSRMEGNSQEMGGLTHLVGS